MAEILVARPSNTLGLSLFVRFFRMQRARRESQGQHCCRKFSVKNKLMNVFICLLPQISFHNSCQQIHTGHPISNGCFYKAIPIKPDEDSFLAQDPSRANLLLPLYLHGQNLKYLRTIKIT